ncbi:XdhC/CoxI family protein [Nakamurella silvestris]|nr:XdhC/CoxI family protein [Nakamurella silvestris]
MRDILTDLLKWWENGETAAVGTVVGTFRSAPRAAGAAMAVGADGSAVGSVSGGCVEGAVYELGTGIRSGGAAVLQRFGVSDDDAFSVGLTCGGIIDIFVEPLSRGTFPEFGVFAAAVLDGTPVAVATVIDGAADRVGRHLLVWAQDGSGPTGSLGSMRLDDAVTDDARGFLAAGRTGVLTYGPDGQRRGAGLRVFISSFAPAPRMLVFGAIDFAAALARIGSFLGYRVTVCDARPVFATAKRFPLADEVVVDWPHRYLHRQAAAGAIDQRTVVCVLTHDPKFDVPLLELALTLPVSYIGAMGSRRTHQDRLEALRRAGVSESDLGRLSSPIGLDLGARTPEETAISIAAEIIARQWSGGGRPLTDLDGAIHQHVEHEAPDFG